VNHGAADRSKSNLYQMAEQNTNPCFIPLRERLTCAAWRHRRRAAAGAPGAARPPPSAMWRSKCAAGRRRRASDGAAEGAPGAARRPPAAPTAGPGSLSGYVAICRGRSVRCEPAALGYVAGGAVR
jgi:hypothetical protein